MLLTCSCCCCYCCCCRTDTHTHDNVRPPPASAFPFLALALAGLAGKGGAGRGWSKRSVRCVRVRDGGGEGREGGRELVKPLRSYGSRSRVQAILPLCGRGCPWSAVSKTSMPWLACSPLSFSPCLPSWGNQREYHQENARRPKQRACTPVKATGARPGRECHHDPCAGSANALLALEPKHFQRFGGMPRSL